MTPVQAAFEVEPLNNISGFEHVGFHGKGQLHDVHTGPPLVDLLPIRYDDSPPQPQNKTLRLCKQVGQQVIPSPPPKNPLLAGQRPPPPCINRQFEIIEDELKSVHKKVNHPIFAQGFGANPGAPPSKQQAAPNKTDAQ